MQTHSKLSEIPGYSTRWIGLVFISLCVVVIAIDNTVLNVAIPSLSRALNASASDLQWILDAYGLVFAALLLTTGTLSDRFGRKRMLQIGLILFAIGSSAAAASNSTATLIASRAFLGIAAAMVLPSTLSIITTTFVGAERLQAFSIWASIFSLGFAVGPIVGGFLLEQGSWQLVFLINLPVIIVALIGSTRYLGESRDHHPLKFDFVGIILSAIGLFTLVYGIIEAGANGWTAPSVLGSLAISIVVLSIFAWWENRNPNAMLPLSVFRNRSFTAASLAVTLTVFAIGGSLFFVSQYYQTVLGYDTLRAGFANLPQALAFFFVSQQAVRISKRFSAKQAITFGIGLAALGMLSMALTFHVDTPYLVTLFGQMLLTIGMASAVSPATNVIMSSVPPEKAGVGSAVNDTTRELGGALGIAILGSVMFAIYRQGVDHIAALFPQLNTEALQAISSSIQGAHAVAATMPADMARVVVNTANAAFVSGITQAMFIGAVISGLGALIVFFALPSDVATQEAPDMDLDRQAVGFAGD
ncbi:MAG: MFS transporter [Chloroflexota bacterium]